MGEVRFGRFRVDPARRVLLVDGQPARLGTRAIDLLIALVEHRQRVVGKDELFERVWPRLVVEENNLQQHISALRKLLGPEAIVTVPGRGYKFMLQADADAPATAASAPTAAWASPGAGAVPNPGPLVGREHDLADLLTCLEAHPLTTLVGPGGVGKTRLAWAAARADRERWRGGVWAVDLSALDRDAMVGAAVAHTLGIVLPAEAPGEDRSSAVAAALRHQALLLVLDNCEHLQAGVSELLLALRRLAPAVHVLATSREPLRLPEERVLRLAPLLASAAAQLFVDRAAAADRRFAPGDAEHELVAEVCQRLGGLPLAIELAAARIPLLGLGGLRQHLDEGLRVLAAGPPHAPARQQTLHAALAWSYGLLSPTEQAVFRVLSVFSGGFSIALAQRVLEPSLDPWAVLDVLGALVDKSMLMADTEGVPRYRLLEPAQAHARERLQGAGEQAQAQQRHARALAAWLREVDRAVATTPHFGTLLRPLLDEADNVRAAMRWLTGVGLGDDVDDAMSAPQARRLAIDLAAHADWLWIEGDPHGDGFRFCAQASAWLDDTVPPALASRLHLACQGQARANGMPASRWAADARAALASARLAADRIGLYRALCSLGGAPRSVIADDEAGALLDEAGALEDPAWSPRLRMQRQLSLEWWHDLGGRLDACREAGQRHLALAREAGSVRSEVGALSNLADTELALGHVDAAIDRCRQAIALAAARGLPTAARHAYSNMVPALLARGDLQDATSAIHAGRECLVRSVGTAVELLLPAALLAWKRGEVQRAALLLGCADSAYAQRGAEPHPPERRMRDTLVAGLQASLPGPALDALQREGAALTEDEGFTRAGLD